MELNDIMNAAIAEMVKKEVARQLATTQQTTRIGTITDVTGPKVRFDGEESASGKAYKCLKSYNPVKDDRVILQKVGNSWVIQNRVDGELVSAPLNHSHPNYIPKAYGYGAPNNDPNQITDTGAYAITGSGVNTPPAGGDGWATILSVNPFGGTDRSFELGHKWNDPNGDLYYRRCTGSTWTAWKKITMV